MVFFLKIQSGVVSPPNFLESTVANLPCNIRGAAKSFEWKDDPLKLRIASRRSNLDKGFNLGQLGKVAFWKIIYGLGVSYLGSAGRPINTKDAWNLCLLGLSYPSSDHLHCFSLYICSHLSYNAVSKILKMTSDQCRIQWNNNFPGSKTVFLLMQLIMNFYWLN